MPTVDIEAVFALWDEVSLRRFSGLQREILRLIIRLSLGRGRTSARVPSLSSFATVGLSKGHIREALTALVQVGVLTWHEERQEIQIATDPSRWLVARRQSEAATGWPLLLALNDSKDLPTSLAGGGIDLPARPGPAAQASALQPTAGRVEDRRPWRGVEVSDRREEPDRRVDGVRPGTGAFRSGTPVVPDGNRAVPPGHPYPPALPHAGASSGSGEIRRSNEEIKRGSLILGTDGEHRSTQAGSSQGTAPDESFAALEDAFRQSVGRGFTPTERAGASETLQRLGANAHLAAGWLVTVSNRFRPQFPGDRIRGWAYFRTAFENIRMTPALRTIPAREAGQHDAHVQPATTSQWSHPTRPAWDGTGAAHRNPFLNDGRYDHLLVG